MFLRYTILCLCYIVLLFFFNFFSVRSAEVVCVSCQFSTENRRTHTHIDSYSFSLSLFSMDLVLTVKNVSTARATFTFIVLVRRILSPNVASIELTVGAGAVG